MAIFDLENFKSNLEGLDITEGAFNKLPVKQQNCIMFKNLTLIRVGVGHYKFNQTIQYVWLGILTLAFGLSKFLGWI